MFLSPSLNSWVKFKNLNYAVNTNKTGTPSRWLWVSYHTRRLVSLRTQYFFPTQAPRLLWEKPCEPDRRSVSLYQAADKCDLFATRYTSCGSLAWPLSVHTQTQLKKMTGQHMSSLQHCLGIPARSHSRGLFGNFSDTLLPPSGCP